jgi:hypothetical protein
VTAADDVPAWEGRTALAGEVNFTIMYAAHDAFTRDLRRLTDACVTGRAWTPDAAATWRRFKAQLRMHHRSEDIALWPSLRNVVSAPDSLAVLDAMEAEHARIDPAIGAIDAALAAGDPAFAAGDPALAAADPALANADPAGMAESVERLSAGLAAHMRHEETEALPLVEQHLGRVGWAVFTTHIRESQGLRGGAEFFPWLLDGAPASSRDRVMDLVPPPVRVLYRTLWAPRYQRAQLALRS